MNNTIKLLKLLKIWIIILLSTCFFTYLGIVENNSISNLIRISASVIFLISVLVTFHEVRINIKKVSIIVILFLIQLISMINGKSISISSMFLIMLNMIFLIIMYLILPTIQINKIFIDRFFKFLIHIGVILCIINIYINLNTVLVFWKSGNAYANAMSCIFSNKNMWGQFLIPVTIANVYILSEKIEVKYLISLLMILFNIFASYSRTSILTIAIFIIFYFLLTDRKNIKRNFILLLLGIIVFAFVINEPSIRNYIQINYFKDDVFTGRNIAWKIGVDSFLKHPFFGVGMGQTEMILNSSGVYLPEFHNAYLECLVSGGILIFIIFLIMIIGSLKAAFGVYRNEKMLGCCFLCSIIAFLVYFCFESLQLFGTSLNQVLITFLIISMPVMANKQSSVAEEI